jgi:thioredoxin-like negative regulator of GroEL
MRRKTRRISPQRRELSPAEFVRIASEADRLAAAGRFGEAAALFTQLRAQQPNDVNVLFALGRCLVALDRADDAFDALREAHRLAPRHVGAGIALADLLLSDARPAEALRVIDALIGAGARDTRLFAAKGNLLAAAGRGDEAVHVLEAALRDAPADVDLAVALAMAGRCATQRDASIGRLELLRRDGNLSASARRTVTFALAECLDAAGRHNDAFTLCAEANAEGASSFDIDGFERAVAATLAAWSSEAATKAPRAPRATPVRPVFVVGMPRSGSSLVEQILASHPSVQANGELRAMPLLMRGLPGAVEASGVTLAPPPESLAQRDMLEIARAYVRRATGRSGRAAVVTDKHPHNSFLLGPIACLFPQTRIVFTQRDPRDTCVSCFMRDFEGVPYARDLAALGRVHRAVDRLMAHWAAVLAIPILTVQYESLVADLEAQSRRLVEFAGLPWDDRCLRFHESNRPTNTASRDQVRQPLYSTSVGRWRRYERHLSPLLDILGDGETGQSMRIPA